MLSVTPAVQLYPFHGPVTDWLAFAANELYPGPVDVELGQRVALGLERGQLELVDRRLGHGEVGPVFPRELVGAIERDVGLADVRELDRADRRLELAVAEQLQEAVLAVLDHLLVEDQLVLGGGDPRFAFMTSRSVWVPVCGGWYSRRGAAGPA